MRLNQRLESAGHFKRRSGVTLVTAIFILLALAATVATTTTMLSSESMSAAKNYSSLKAFYIAEAGLEYLRAELKQDSDWSDRTDVSVNLFGGRVDVDYIWAHMQQVEVNVTGRYGGAEKTIKAFLLANVTAGLPEAFDYAVFWGNSTGAASQLQFSTVGVNGNVAAKGNVRVGFDSAIQPGTVFIPLTNSLQIDPGGVVSSWERSAVIPNFPTCDYTFYNGLINTYQGLLALGPPKTYNWKEGVINLAGDYPSDKVDIHGTVTIRGSGRIIATDYINIYENATIDPVGGEIVFVSNGTINVSGSAKVLPGTWGSVFNTRFFANGSARFLDFVSLSNILAMSATEVSANGSAAITNNSVFYVPDDGDSITFLNNPRFAGSVLCRGKLWIYGGDFTGLLYCDSRSGIYLSHNFATTRLNGSMVSDVFDFNNNQLIQTMSLSWNQAFLPAVIPTGLGTDRRSVRLNSWAEIYD